MGITINTAVILAFLAAGVRLATPLLYAAFGGVLCERSGVINIGLEGMMIAGTFGGYVGSLVTHSAWGGVAGGLLAGFLFGFLFAIMTVVLRAEQVVIGTGVNLFALGLTAFLFRAMSRAGVAGYATKFQPWKIPYLSDIPFIGDIFFRQNPLIYVGYILIPVLAFFLYRTTWGLKLRGAGEHPRAADTAGINVWWVRITAVTLGGGLAGLGGAVISVGELSTFLEGLIAGRGFIALAAVIFGRWDPLKVAGACLLFGLADALQLRLQTLAPQIPYQFLLMFPYVLTLVTFVLLIHRARPPASLGKPYPESQG